MSELRPSQQRIAKRYVEPQPANTKAEKWDTIASIFVLAVAAGALLVAGWYVYCGASK